MKVFYFDVETTGVVPRKHDIIQIAGIVEIDGVEKETFNITMQPFDYEAISPSALKVNKTTVKKLRKYQTPQDAYKELMALLGRHVDKFDKRDKFYLAGYNVGFDIDFLKAFFTKNEDKYYGSWFNYRKIDPIYLLPVMHYRKLLPDLPTHKLSDVCDYFKIELDAHDALSDIVATKELLRLLMELM